MEPVLGALVVFSVGAVGALILVEMDRRENIALASQRQAHVKQGEGIILQLREENARLTEDLREAQERKGVADDHAKMAAAQCADLAEACDQLRGQSGKLESEIATLRISRDGWQANTVRAEEQLSKLTDERNALLAEKRRLFEVNSQAASEIARLQSALCNLRDRTVKDVSDLLCEV